MEKEGEELT